MDLKTIAVIGLSAIGVSSMIGATLTLLFRKDSADLDGYAVVGVATIIAIACIA